MSHLELAEKTCVPCTGGTPRLEREEIDRFLDLLGGGWRVVDGHHLEKEYQVRGYPPAVHFANKVARIAEEQDHHPDILFSWGKVKVTVWTHKIDGLSESDFVLAAKAEEAFSP